MPIHPNTKQCSYTKVDGVRCGSPAWEEGTHCYHHAGLKNRFEKKEMSIPPLDDQNSIQVALMDVINGLLSKRISRLDATALLYAIQIAKSNLKGLTLVLPSPDVVAEKIAAAKAEMKVEFEREFGSDYDENGEPISLSAILLKELRDSANFKPDSPAPTGLDSAGINASEPQPGDRKPVANVSGETRDSFPGAFMPGETRDSFPDAFMPGEPRDPSQPREVRVVDLTKIDLSKGEFWTDKKSS